MSNKPYLSLLVGLSMMRPAPSIVELDVFLTVTYASVSGTIYLYSVLAPTLRSNFNLSTTQTALLGTSANIGVWAAIIPGLVTDRFGPIASGLLAATLLSSGFGGLAALLKYFSGQNVSVVLLCFLAFLYGQGSACNYASSVSTTARNFDPRDRGQLVGVLTCFFGLCAAIYALLYWAVGQDAPLFVALLAILTSLVSIVGGIVFRFFGQVAEGATSPRVLPWKMRAVFWISVTAALYLAASHGALIMLSSAINSLLLSRVLGVGLCLLFLAMGSVLHGELFGSSGAASFSKVEALPSGEGDEANMPPEVESTVFDTVRTGDFWLLFTAFFVNVGTAIITVNHLADVTFSRGSLGDGNMVPLLVALFSSSNSLGRLGFGWLSDFLFSRGFERALGLVICSSVSAVLQLWLIFAPASHFLAAVPLLGLVFGGTYCLLPQLCSLYFGSKNFGLNWGAFGVAPALGSILMSTLVAGSMADYVAALHGNETRCVGNDCYGYTYFICFGLGLISAVVSVVLWRRRANKTAAGSSAIPLTDQQEMVAPDLDASDSDQLILDKDSPADSRSDE